MNSILPPPLGDIKEIYMERPSRYAHWALGFWFLEAHGLAHGGIYPAKYTQLALEQNPSECLRIISALGIERLPLENLSAWNKESERDPF